ncbi:MAG: radical SAM protein [Deltaproteobacteria bacterium]|nr:radical SAM protein [Deltaproteobacteria bacterium]
MNSETVEKNNELSQISPDYVRISMAAAIELGLKPGRISCCSCDCINLLQNYPQGCYANCTYCGLARERPGIAEDNSFIRVDWPLFPTDLVAEKIGELERKKEVGRVCVAQVQDHRANNDLVDMISRVHHRAPEVPISALVTATLLNDEWLVKIKEAGADIIGVGLDAASEELFYSTRGKGTKGPHDWKKHWKIIRKAREMYGPMKVNCHLIVGLGESDRDLVEMFYLLKSEEIAAYLFSFNPEPGTIMENTPRTPITRTRRIQLVKNLIEEHELPESSIEFDKSGTIRMIAAPRKILKLVTENGMAFMTDGCPDRQGKMACNRPYGSYRPGEEFRDYPFLPDASDLKIISKEMKLAEIVKSNESALV